MDERTRYGFRILSGNSDSSCKVSVSDFVLYSFSHKFLAGDGGDAAKLL